MQNEPSNIIIYISFQQTFIVPLTEKDSLNQLVDWFRLVSQPGFSWFYLTWNDDIRETQFFGDGDVPREETHVILTNLLHISM